MDIKAYIKQLRQAADTLENLLYSSNPSDNPKAAKSILKGKRSKKVYGKHNPHWTQKPENKKKLHKMVMAGNKARNSQ